MDDLISRKALLEKVQYRIDTPGIIGSTIRDMVATTRRIIEEEPAVAYNLSSTEAQWIPVAEKLLEEHKILTNADRIRKMNDRELAEFLAKKFTDQTAREAVEDGSPMTATYLSALAHTWYVHWMNWLRQPAKDE